MENIARFLGWIEKLTLPLARLIIKYKQPLSFCLLLAAFASLPIIFYPKLGKFAGELSWKILIAILVLSPVARITQLAILKNLMPFRKEAGILMGFLALEHGIAFVSKSGLPFSSLFYFVGWFEKGRPSLAFGSLALMLVIPLLLTSNRFAMKILGINWKHIHRLAYLILIFSALHVALIKYDFFKAGAVIIGYATLKILDMRDFRLDWKKQNNLSPSAVLLSEK